MFQKPANYRTYTNIVRQPRHAGAQRAGTANNQSICTPAWLALYKASMMVGSSREFIFAMMRARFPARIDGFVTHQCQHGFMQGEGRLQQAFQRTPAPSPVS